MGLYSRYVLPRLLDFAMRDKPIMRQRAKVVPLAHGRVLEVGIGSGLNLSFYDKSKVDKVLGLDPSPELNVWARQRAAEAGIDVDWLALSSERIPLPDDSVDSIVITYTMCTIPDVHSALLEMRRVLRPGASMYFSEHGVAPDASVRKWQNRLNPLWGKLAGGCNINRNVPKLLEDAGLHLDEIETMYLPGPRPLTFNYWGSASKA
ncbi:MAG TPA: class I SAM-dependent methyltransferase [Candidatus Limnocylindrales bacterium]|jgi:ubiquinone/menaquinone biosynthesis C-methylase UbiE|nr:class I SAM-dependent methyltransferase [Candidatus Limnocylindrales bacterium]